MVAMAHTDEFLPKKNFFDAAENQARIIEGLYKKYPQGVEFVTSAHKLADELNTTYSIITRVIGILEDKGILSRRIEYRENGVIGRTAYYTLKVPLVDAQRLFVEYQKGMIAELSLKKRIMVLLSDGSVWQSPNDIARALKANGWPSTDTHNLTHVLHSLKRENRITFSTGSTNDKIPYGIKLAKGASMVVKEKEIPEVVVESTPEVIAAPEPFSAVVEDSLAVSIKQFPLITKLIHKVQVMENASKMLAEAGQEDLSIMLEERMTLSDFEREAINVYIAYLGCKSK